MEKIKTAEMTINQIIVVFILVVSFAIILTVYLRFNFTDQIDRVACKESVLLRHTFNLGSVEIGRNYIPLKCQTEKICFSVSGEDCSDQNMVSTKTNKVNIVKLKENPDKAKEKVLDVMADSYFGCHVELGEGNLDFMPKGFNEENYGLICSRFAFEESAQNVLESISLEDIYNKLEEKKDDKGNSYLFRIYMVKDADYFRTNFYKLKAEGKYSSIEYGDLKYLTNFTNGYALIAQESKEGFLKTYVLPLIKSFVLKQMIVDAMFLSLPEKKLENKDYYYTPPYLFEYDLETLNKMKCSFEFDP